MLACPESWYMRLVPLQSGFAASNEGTVERLARHQDLASRNSLPKLQPVNHDIV